MFFYIGKGGWVYFALGISSLFSILYRSHVVYLYLLLIVDGGRESWVDEGGVKKGVLDWSFS